MHPRLASLAPLWAALAVSLAPAAALADFIDHFSNPADVGAAKTPSRGEVRVLVLTIEVDGYPPLNLEALRDYFSPNDALDGQERFTDFYARMSLGAFRPVGEVMEPLRFEGCPLPEDYFGYEDCAIPRGGGASSADKLTSLNVGLGLLEEVLRRADEELGVDFSRYDLSGPQGEPDGWIDGVLLLHNINFGGIALPLYALRPEGPLALDGVQVNIVGIAESPAVALHEFGHLLGWADLYDESGQTKGLQYSHMGSWGYDEPAPALDAFSRIAAGWSSPMMTLRPGEEARDVRLPRSADSGAVVQLGEGTEYFLVEHRGKSRGDYLDAGLVTRGLAIYHVNLDRYPSERDGQWALRLVDCLNCEPWAPMLMNEQADGLFELQRPGFRRDDRGDLFQPGDELVPSPDNTRPLGSGNRALSSNRYDGAVTGVWVTNIREDGEDFLVDFRVDEPCSLLSCGAPGCEDGRCLAPPEEEEAPDLGQGDVGVEEEADMGAPAALGQREGEGCAAPPQRPGWGRWGGLGGLWRRR
jgi:M6 family metalloprotease-like protein